MKVLRFDTVEAWRDAVVKAWCQRLRATPRLRHCLAAGSTPNPIYAGMVAAAKRGDVSFRQAEVFILDEFGGLDPRDAGRCDMMLHWNLLAHVDLPAGGLHKLNPDARDLEAECRSYDAQIGPGFDLALLGLGLNGHLGMNEPGSAADSPTRRADLHPETIRSSARYVGHNRLPTWGLTVGMKQLLAAREVWLLATGPAKAEIVRRTVRGGISTRVPSSLLRRHPDCTLFLDAEAAALLKDAE